MGKRRRVSQTKSLHDRLGEFARRAQEEAEKLPPGPERDAALRKAQQAQTGAHIDEWINSEGMKPPK